MIGKNLRSPLGKIPMRRLMRKKMSQVDAVQRSKAETMADLDLEADAWMVIGASVLGLVSCSIVDKEEGSYRMSPSIETLNVS